MTDKDQIARELAESHRLIEPGIVRIQRITTLNEANPAEPVKLLEVNSETPPSGIVPIAFGAATNWPYPSVLIEVTPNEFELLQADSLRLPEGWELGEVLFEAAGAVVDGGD